MGNTILCDGVRFEITKEKLKAEISLDILADLFAESDRNFDDCVTVHKYNYIKLAEIFINSLCVKQDKSVDINESPLWVKICENVFDKFTDSEILEFGTYGGFE